MKHKYWLRKLAEGEELILPSGLEVRVKPVDSNALLVTDYPTELMTIIRQHMTGRNASEKELFESLSDSDKAIEASKSTRAWGEIIAKNVVIYPKLVDGAAEGEDEFPISALETGDLGKLFALINLPLAQLPSFCRQQNAAMELVFAGALDTSDAVEGDGVASDDFVADAGDGATTLPLDGAIDDDQRVANALPL